MRCTKCKRLTKGHKKPTGKHCSLSPIASDVVAESHKGTNTNGPEHVMRRTEVSQNSIIGLHILNVCVWVCVCIPQGAPHTTYMDQASLRHRP